MTRSTTDLSSAAVSGLSLHDLLARIERRLGDTRTFGREVDALFRQLMDRTSIGWPDDLETTLSVALFALRLAETWAARCPDAPPRILGLVSDVAIVEVARAMPDVDRHWADEFIQTYEAASTDTRSLLARIAADQATERTRREIDRRVSLRLMQLRSPAALDAKSVARGPHRLRDLARLQALVRAADGDHEGALAALDDNPTGDPLVLTTFAELHRQRGDLDASSHALRRAVIAATEARGVRESLLDVSLERDANDEIIEALVAIVGAGSGLVAWQAIADHFEDAPDRLAAVRDGLRDMAPGAWVSVLIEERDVAGVVEAAEGRRYAFEHLWQMADFLADHDAKAASRLYERAIKLEGSVARSRTECVAFASRVEKALPFFERIGKTTRPRRFAREVVKRSRNHVPLKRELERVLDTKL